MILAIAGVSRQSFSLEVNAKDYGFEPTDTPRTDRSVQFLRHALIFYLMREGSISVSSWS